ncbi:globin [Pseudoclavibacter terrae]|uniref:Globin n=2 Tax=Pseudoclavibacter terrae TaxID=1530195 RepID=A0A7J5AYM6_9MICO|nr:globin [Pseudoclavibacter terrae]
MSNIPIHLRGSDGGASAVPTLYDEIGGMPAFDKLAAAFYEGVRDDPLMWRMYPQDDLEGATWRLGHFLAQYFGGPSEYSAQRGHPRLRMRHNGFHINPEAREHWLRHMHAAMDQLELSPIHRAQMTDYFDRAATAMVNTFEPSPGAETDS